MKQSAKEYFELGFRHLESDELPKAIDMITLGLRLEPDNYDAIANRCACCALAGRYPEALVDAERLLVLNPNDVRGHLCRCNILAELELFQDALKAYDAAIAKYPDEPAHFVNRGFVRLELGHASLALADHDAALALNSQFPAALIGRARSLRDLGLLADSVRAYEKLLDFQDDDLTPLVAEAEEELLDVRNRLRGEKKSGNTPPDAEANT